MRSARLTIAAATLLLVALPLAMLVIARGYELMLVERYRALLARVAAEANLAEPQTLQAVGTREGVEIRILDSEAKVIADSNTATRAVSGSLVGHTVETLLDRMSVGVPRESLVEIEAAFPPMNHREEVRSALNGEPFFVLRTSTSGQTVVLTQAVPRPGGGVVLVTRASHRGIRQLLLVRREFEKLVAYQALFALLLAFVLARWLVRPLEQLARGARRYPQGAIAAPELLDRSDEIGQLARSMSGLAHTLEERRRGAADVAADFAHELKNPLATIAASTELLSSKAELSADTRAQMQGHITAAVERLRETTDSLLALLRLEVALPDEKRERVAYAEWLRELIAAYEREPAFSAFTFQTELGGDVGEVSLVPRAWARLIGNLLDNALVQPTDRKQIFIRAFRDPRGVWTEVSDFGPGVSPGNRDKIFRRFFTHRPVGVPPGTGLGLSIVQTIAAAHGGEVELAPSEAGKGATFRVLLP